MKRSLLYLVVMMLFSLAVCGQDKSLFLKQWLIQNGDTLPYRLLLPKNYSSSQQYPVIFFLHGSGERGNDNEKQLIHGSSLFLRDSIMTNYPAIVVFPQCSVTTYWSNVNMVITDNNKRSFYFIEDGAPSKAMILLMALVNNIFVRYPVDKKRVFVGGLSMGGMGTYELVRRMPKTFAAAFAICGGANPAIAKQLRKTKWWLFHGLKDDVVLPVFTKNMEAALKQKHADVRATYYPNANHNSWDSAFAEPGLMKWLFSIRR